MSTTDVAFFIGMWCAGVLFVPSASVVLLVALCTISGAIAPDPGAGVITDERA